VLSRRGVHPSSLGCHRTRTPRLTCGIGLFVAVSLGACKPGVDSRCDKGDSRCLDHDRALTCQNGRFIETACRGKAGCRLEGEATACDVHGNQPGDVCSTDDEGAAVCLTENSMLSCRHGKYANVPCRGVHGCSEADGRAECDETVAESGEACGHDGKTSCSADGKRVLLCANGVTETHYQCRGERGCTVSGGKIDCDVSIARNGDACDTLFEGTYACTEDGAAIVRCVNGRFEADETCKHGMRCLAEPGTTRCAKPPKAANAAAL